MAKELFAAQILKIRVLHPAGADILVGQIESVFEYRQPGHQPGRQRRHARAVAIDLAEAMFQKRPIDGVRQPHQFMGHVEYLIEPRAEQILFICVAAFGWSGHSESSLLISRTGSESRLEMKVNRKIKLQGNTG